MAVAVPALAFAASATVTANVNVRSGPGANYARLAALPAGVSVNVGSCRGSWCQIYNGNRVGFVSARYVRFGSYNGNAYAAPSNTTVIVGNDGYNDGWAPGFGLGLGLGWATGGGYWGPGWGGPGWRGGPNYYNGCIGRNCQSNRGGGRNGWNPRWGHGPQWGGRGWPQGQVRGNWGLVRLWGRASHLVRVVSAGLTDQHSVIVVLVVAACILETCVPCMPDGRNNHL